MGGPLTLLHKSPPHLVPLYRTPHCQSTLSEMTISAAVPLPLPTTDVMPQLTAFCATANSDHLIAAAGKELYIYNTRSGALKQYLSLSISPSLAFSIFNEL